MMYRLRWGSWRSGLGRVVTVMTKGRWRLRFRYKAGKEVDMTDAAWGSVGGCIGHHRSFHRTCPGGSPHGCCVGCGSFPGRGAA